MVNSRAMATKGNSFGKAQRNLQGLAIILQSAACEWVLIFLMLIDALLSYVLTKFAYICKLQTPCILCSRLDHLLGKEKTNNYRNLLCTNHRLEISSLVSCSIHDKLVDGNEMCDACLCSFANKSKSDFKMQRLLVGKLRAGTGGNGAQGLLPNRDSAPHCIGGRSCSCCCKPWRSRPNAQGFLQLKSSVNEATKPNIPLPRRVYSRDRLKRMRDKISGSVTLHHPGKTGFDLLSHVGYTELKITSDSDSEFMLSEDDDYSHLICEKSELKEDSLLQSLTKIPSKPRCNNYDQVKASINFFDSRPSPLESYVQVDVQKPHNVKSLAPDSTTFHGLCELNWLPDNQTINPSTLPELISLDDALPISKAFGLPCGKSMEKSNFTDSVSQDSTVSCLPTLDRDMQFVGISATSAETGMSNIGFTSLIELEDGSTLISPTVGGCPKTDEVVGKSVTRNIDNMDQSNVRESSVTDKEQKIFGYSSGQPSEKELDIVTEDLEQFPIEAFSSGQINLLSNEGQHNSSCFDDLPEAIASEFNIIQVLDKSASVETDVESLDGSYVSVIEGENIVARLRRQVDHDRTFISSLYKELEAERNASEVAANQAMAMITRLQEEKAAVHMEALQYLRMMEEQAEYDVEALEKANDLLTEKEKDIQDLEAELEFYKANYVDDTIVEIEHEKSHGMNGEDVTAETNSVRCCEYDGSYSFKSTIAEPELSKRSNRSLNLETLSLEFEDEKMYIQVCLRGLEDKINKISTKGQLSTVDNSIDIEKLVNIEGNDEENIDVERSLRNREQNGPSMHIDKETCNGTVTAKDEFVDSDNKDNFGHEENFSNLQGQISCEKKREVDLPALEHEISELTGRLEALQAGHDFLEHSLNSLHYGEEGLQFIQDIAYRLQELCKLGIRLDRQSGS